MCLVLLCVACIKLCLHCHIMCLCFICQRDSVVYVALFLFCVYAHARR
nr:MAG TPA: Envelope small membrane protein [Caudoviricetes sp.]